MANIQNLKPRTDLTSEEAKRLGSLGGKASGKARAKKKMLRDILEMALSVESKKNDTNGDKYLDIVVGLIKEAEKGNPKAFEVIRDTMGQKPVEQIQNINPPQIIIERPDK